jgi:tetratricopeptide (TPR) repeat protein
MYGTLGYLDKALEKKPNDVFIMYYKGKILLTIQRYEEAISYFDKALVIDPLETTILFYQSIAKLMLGDKESGFLVSSK